MQLTIRDSCILSRFISLPDNRRLIGTGFEVPVDAIIAHIGFRTLEPFNRNRSVTTVIIISTYRFPLGIPVEFIGHLGPKTFRIINTFLIHGLIFFHVLKMRILRSSKGRLYKIVRISHKGKAFFGLYLVNF